MYFYCYVFLLLYLCILTVYMFRSGYSVSLCCSMYCLCVNVYCTTATGCQTQLQLTNIYHKWRKYGSKIMYAPKSCMVSKGKIFKKLRNTQRYYVIMSPHNYKITISRLSLNSPAHRKDPCEQAKEGQA